MSASGEELAWKAGKKTWVGHETRRHQYRIALFVFLLQNRWYPRLRLCLATLLEGRDASSDGLIVPGYVWLHAPAACISPTYAAIVTFFMS